MQPPIEEESAAKLRLIDGPAGEAAGRFGDVLLCVASIHAEGVQLQQFAAVVLVQSSARAIGGSACGHIVLTDRLPIVQVEKHRRTLSRRSQQIAELAQHVRPDRLTFVLGYQITVSTLVEIDIEMI